MVSGRLTAGEQAVLRRDRLSNEQVEAISKVATSGTRLDLLVGPAGAGKTTVMHAVELCHEPADEGPPISREHGCQLGDVGPRCRPATRSSQHVDGRARATATAARSLSIPRQDCGEGTPADTTDARIEGRGSIERQPAPHTFGEVGDDVRRRRT